SNISYHPLITHLLHYTIYIQIFISPLHLYFISFFFNDTATTEIYTLSLHDALPIYYESYARTARVLRHHRRTLRRDRGSLAHERDRKSTRLNSSHGSISYAVFCLKKKKKKIINIKYLNIKLYYISYMI